MPLGTFKVTRHLGKFKVKKLDGGNLKAGDDQLEDVVYNDDYGDVDDDFTKRRRSNWEILPAPALKFYENPQKAQPHTMIDDQETCKVIFP